MPDQTDAQRIEKLRKIIEMICAHAESSEDGNDFNKWVIENADDWRAASNA